MDSLSDKKLIEMIKEKDQKELNEKSKRLKLLISNTTDEYIPIPSLAFQYFEEARLCYYSGAFIATIFMVHLAFEELLRNHYRVIREMKEKLISKKGRQLSVDKVSFSELIDNAKKECYVSKDDAKKLHKLRKIRNSLQHTKDVPPYERSLLKSWYGQEIELRTNIEKDARWAIKLLLDRFLNICEIWKGF